ncbi:hypothetical protein ABW21_db0206156 [Orbilia brochopaga]|nr:hypothetical protein ABW21_db0206156 [Drechslerella brochopaga]
MHLAKGAKTVSSFPEVDWNFNASPLEIAPVDKAGSSLPHVQTLLLQQDRIRQSRIVTVSCPKSSKTNRCRRAIVRKNLAIATELVWLGDSPSATDTEHRRYVLVGRNRIPLLSMTVRVCRF